jgi:hypothetical protein
MSSLTRDAVRALQTALNARGFDAGDTDGIKGPNTLDACFAYVADTLLDGQPKLPTELRFKGDARRLDDIDLPRIGHLIGVGEDELHAVIDVEARGSGFDSLGRIAMLFEPHIFYRELGPGAKRDKAVAQGLAYPSWKRKYPSDSYLRLRAAMKIDEEAALRSASWGLGQIMGFNAEMIGYGSARAMVEDFVDDEEHHLEAMVSYIVAAGLDDELRAHDWRGFARGYNGPGYATHGYHTKLGASFLKWQAIPDTPFTTEVAT